MQHTAFSFTVYIKNKYHFPIANRRKYCATYLVKLAENWMQALNRWAGFIKNEPQIRIIVMPQLAVWLQESI